MLICALQGCATVTSTSVAIPSDCNEGLKPVPHADVKGDNAKVAWMKERAQTDRANGRIAGGAQCWSGVVESYAKGQ